VGQVNEASCSKLFADGIVVNTEATDTHGWFFIFDA
jgi:hypothetical protein